MNYIEAIFTCTPNEEIIREVLSATLAEIGFESFMDNDTGLTAYIPEKLFDAGVVRTAIETFPLDAGITFTHSLISDRNWNEEWEKNYFSPLVINDTCVVKSTFHKDVPDYDYNILIDPKMAFGTGHHQTTELMIKEMLKEDFNDKSVLDMGCGTAILAILASMRGADPVVAIDIDEWAYDNAIENLGLNQIANVDVKIGGAELLDASLCVFDIILANINRNILLQDIEKYVSVLKSGGVLFMSGFYREDIAVIEEQANNYGLKLDRTDSKDNWAVVKFVQTV